MRIMTMRVVIICMVAMMAVAQAPTEKRESRPPVASVDQQELQALTNDIARMQSLVRQMEMNLAFVQTTQTPLKHQFELEIDTWRVVLNGMERRVQRLRGTTTGGAVPPGTVPLRQDSRQGRP
ncbi:MAG: hypothetical protein LAN70_06575 [Acidobacteriia bacterium]|nr:hypothetical protein [Terriglobia bacterium]